MRKITLIFAAVTIVTASMLAQETRQQRKSPEERTEKIVAKMKTDLTLSDDQVSKLKPIILKREQQHDERREKISTEKEDQKKRMKDTEDEFKKILTPEQMEKLKQQRKEMHEKHKDHQ